MSLKKPPLHLRCSSLPKTASDVLAGEIISLDAILHMATALRTTSHRIRKFLENVSGWMDVLVYSSIFFKFLLIYSSQVRN